HPFLCRRERFALLVNLEIFAPPAPAMPRTARSPFPRVIGPFGGRATVRRPFRCRRGVRASMITRRPTTAPVPAASGAAFVGLLRGCRSFLHDIRGVCAQLRVKRPLLSHGCLRRPRSWAGQRFRTFSRFHLLGGPRALFTRKRGVWRRGSRRRNRRSRRCLLPQPQFLCQRLPVVLFFDVLSVCHGLLVVNAFHGV